MGVQNGEDLSVGKRQFDFQNRAFKIEIAINRVSRNARQPVTSRFSQAVPGKEYQHRSGGSENFRMRYELRFPIIGRHVILHLWRKSVEQESQLIQVSGSARP